MKVLLDNIAKLKNVSLLSKHEQLVNGILDTIASKDLKSGDRLPSINKMVAEVGYARKTIVKAYEDLKGRGIVESKNFKGYYIANVNTKTKLRVCLVLYSFKTFQEDFYNTFREELGKGYIINVFFHHNNLDVFTDILNRTSGRYGMYVVAPVQAPTVSSILKQIPEDKLLVIDRYVALPATYSYIVQEFEESTYSLLEQLLPFIKNYKKFVLFYRDDKDYPIGILNAFNRFVVDFDVNGKVVKRYKQDSIVEGNLYFFISDGYLWEVLRDSKTRGFALGKNIGIIAHDDSVVKEIVFGGITTVSTDFKKMALEAANYVKFREHIRKTIPSELIHRNSL